jgi:hypothetical protein
MSGVLRIALVWSKLSICALFVFASGTGAAADSHGGRTSGAPAQVEIRNEHGSNGGVKPGQQLTVKEMQDRLTQARDRLNADSAASMGIAPQAVEQTKQAITKTVDELPSSSPERQKMLSSVLTAKDIKITNSQVTATNETAGILGFNGTEKSTSLTAISDEQKKVIAQTNARQDPATAAAVTAALVAQSMSSGPADLPKSNAGVESSGPQSQAFDNTQSKALGAGGLSGSSSTGPSDHFNPDAMNLAKGAQNVLSLPTSSSGGDLSSSPIYNQAGSPEIQSALRDIAFGDMTGKSGSSGGSKLLKLATTEGFQDVLSNTLGSDAQRDFNLMTAGAAISGNPNLPASGVALAKAYIYNNLSSSKMIASSQVLGSLNAALPGGGLGKLAPETLRWIALSGDLAFADAASLPPEYASRQAQYREGFESLKAWLKLLEESNALSLLDELRVPADPDLASRGWDDAKKKFAGAHRKAKASLLVNKKSGKDGKSIVKQLDTLALWAEGVSDFDVTSVSTWGRMSSGRYRFPVLWKRFDPLTLEQARFYYGRLMFYGSMPQFYSGSQKPVSFLVGDAQKWSAKITKEQQLRRNELARTKPGRPAAKKQNVAFVKEN